MHPPPVDGIERITAERELARLHLLLDGPGRPSPR
jgi:hypothetical protein